MIAPRTYTLTALTDIWTGDASGKGERLITTGLLGSLRWWFEVVVRGLGGSACDPSHHKDNRPGPCPQPAKKPHDAGHHCVVCALFGCTGWARKFRFDVLDGDGKPQQDQIKAGQTFQLRLTELRLIRDEEWALLDLTLRLIAEYGAIGGKTVLKPSDEPALADTAFDAFNDNLELQQQVRNSLLRRGDKLLQIEGKRVPSRSDVEALIRSLPTGRVIEIEIERDGTKQSFDAWIGKKHHQDLGLVELVSSTLGRQFEEDELRRYVSWPKWRKLHQGDFAWASLQHFWCFKRRYLARQNSNTSSFNRVIGRPEPKAQAHKNDSWVAGGRGESKKVFSFKDPESARRTFGFVQSANEFDAMKQRLREKAWKDLKDDEFVTGAEILRRLLGQGGPA